jgi:hypothetical protein
MDEWVWRIGGMILTGETEVLGEKHYTASVVDEWMSMEHWWNGTDRGNWSTGREMFQCQFIYHECESGWPEALFQPPKRTVGQVAYQRQKEGASITKCFARSY